MKYFGLTLLAPFLLPFFMFLGVLLALSIWVGLLYVISREIKCGSPR